MFTFVLKTVDILIIVRVKIIIYKCNGNISLVYLILFENQFLILDSLQYVLKLRQ